MILRTRTIYSLGVSYPRWLGVVFVLGWGFLGPLNLLLSSARWRPVCWGKIGVYSRWGSLCYFGRFGLLEINSRLNISSLIGRLTTCSRCISSWSSGNCWLRMRIEMHWRSLSEGFDRLPILLLAGWRDLMPPSYLLLGFCRLLDCVSWSFGLCAPLLFPSYLRYSPVCCWLC